MTRFEIIPLVDITKRIEDSWIELIDVGKFNPTLHPYWLKVILSSWKMNPSLVNVFLLYDGTKLLSVIPYIIEINRRLGFPLKVISLTSSMVSYHAEIVCRYDVKQTLDIFLANVTGWDKINIPNATDDGPTSSAIRKLVMEKKWRFFETPVDNSPFLPLKGNLEDLIASKAKKFRYKYRKRNELLSKADDLQLKWYHQLSDVKDFISAFFEVESNSWKAKSGVEVAESNREGPYYSELLPFLAQNKAMVANVLWKQNQPIAYSLCCHWGDWFGHLKTGFDARFDGLSPGAIVIDGCIEEAFKVNAKEFDFLGTPGKMQPEPHKLHWTKKMRRHVRFEIYSHRPIPKVISLLKEIRDKDFKLKKMILQKQVR